MVHFFLLLLSLLLFIYFSIISPHCWSSPIDVFYFFCLLGFILWVDFVFPVQNLIERPVYFLILSSLTVFSPRSYLTLYQIDFFSTPTIVMICNSLNSFSVAFSASATLFSIHFFFVLSSPFCFSMFILYSPLNFYLNWSDVAFSSFSL